MSRIALSIFVLIFSFLAQAQPASALVCGILGCSCDVTATPVDFGNLNPLSGAQDAEGEVTVDCTGLAELAPTMLVRLQSGQFGTVTARKMRSAAGDLLDYGLYTTSQRNIVWGTGALGSTVTVSGGLLAIGHWTVTRRVYARVFPTTATKPGSYSDSVVVRIDW